MSQNSLVRAALNNRWLEEQGVPDMKAPSALASLMDVKRNRMDGAKRSQSSLDCSTLRAECPCLMGTALYGAVSRVVRDLRLAELMLSQSRVRRIGVRELGVRELGGRIGWQRIGGQRIGGQARTARH